MTLIVAVGYEATVANGQTVSSVTYNSVGLTSKWDVKESSFNKKGTSVWYMTGAPCGSAHNVVVTFSAAVNVAAASASSWTGVDQSTPLRTNFNTEWVDPGPSPAQAVVSNAVSGDVVVDAFMSNANTGFAGGQTVRDSHVNFDGNNSTQAHSSANATGSTTMSYTWTGNAAWALGAVALIPSSGGGPDVTKFYKRRIQ